MSSYDMKRFAKDFVSLERRHNALARSTQLGFATVLDKAGNPVDLTQAVSDSSDAIEQVEAVNDLTKELTGTVEGAVSTLNEVPTYLTFLDETRDDINEVFDHAFEQQERIQEALDEAKERLEATAEELNSRLDLTEETLTGAKENLEIAEGKLQALQEIADELANAEPLTTSELLALIATIDTAFINSGMIKSLDVGKLTATETSTFNEAVIQKLFAEVVQAKVVEITEELIGANGTFTGKLTADHLDVQTLSGSTINGLRINGGAFVQYASTEPARIYPLQNALPVQGDWKGGTTHEFSNSPLRHNSDGYITITRNPGEGTVSALWLNEGRVTSTVTPGNGEGSSSTRYVRATVSSSTALEFLHVISNVVPSVNTEDTEEDSTDADVVEQGGYINETPNSSRREFDVVFSIPPGVKFDWVHIGADAVDKTQPFTLTIKSFSILESRELGAHMRIDKLAGTPGLYGYTAPGLRTVAVTPGAITSYTSGGPKDNRSVRISGDEVRFTQGGKLLGANTAKSFTELSTWNVPEGTWAWVLDLRDFFVKVGDRWLRDPSKYYNAGDTYQITAPGGRGTVVTLPAHLTDASRALTATVMLPKQVTPGTSAEVSLLRAVGRGAQSGYWSLSGSDLQDVKHYATAVVIRGDNLIEVRLYNPNKWFNENNTVVSLGVAEMSITFK